jgi:cyclic pyranopterin phosphate synthase
VITVEAPKPVLADQHGRVATDLRVSLTDRCDLRCICCLPADGLPWLPRQQLLTDAEVIRLIGLAVTRLGVGEVRFTGGEPLLRPGLEQIIGATAALRPRPDISMTTNGLGLATRADRLVAAGLTRINVSLDTLRADRFHALARRDRLEDTLAGLAAAHRVGLQPVKVNTVLVRGHNDDEAPELLRFCLEHGYELRFIEQMPLDADHAWQRASKLSAAEILASLSCEFALTPLGERRGSAPAERWLVDGGPATVGIIASVTRPFCAACARTRLTADGQVRNCLFSATETDLRGLLRAGAGDLELARQWQTAMWGKAAGHGIGTAEFAAASRSMSAIGG